MVDLRPNLRGKLYQQMKKTDLDIFLLELLDQVMTQMNLKKAALAVDSLEKLFLLGGPK